MLDVYLVPATNLFITENDVTFKYQIYIITGVYVNINPVLCNVVKCSDTL